jgi:hypothetical protein
MDMLDNTFMNSSDTKLKLLGESKRKYEQAITIGTDKP